MQCSASAQYVVFAVFTAIQRSPSLRIPALSAPSSSLRTSQGTWDLESIRQRLLSLGAFYLPPAEQDRFRRFFLAPEVVPRGIHLGGSWIVVFFYSALQRWLRRVYKTLLTTCKALFSAKGGGKAPFGRKNISEILQGGKACSI